MNNGVDLNLLRKQRDWLLEKERCLESDGLVEFIDFLLDEIEAYGLVTLGESEAVSITHGTDTSGKINGMDPAVLSAWRRQCSDF
jgi:hypothetical protein